MSSGFENMLMKRLIICILFAFALMTGAKAQSFTLTTASELPSFEGGAAAFAEKVMEKAGSVDVPESVGKVTVGFYVTTEGKIVMPKVLKGLDAVSDDSARETLSQALVSAVQAVDESWSPALDSSGSPMTWYTVVVVPLAD